MLDTLPVDPDMDPAAARQHHYEEQFARQVLQNAKYTVLGPFTCGWVLVVGANVVRMAAAYRGIFLLDAAAHVCFDLLFVYGVTTTLVPAYQFSRLFMVSEVYRHCNMNGSANANANAPHEPLCYPRQNRESYNYLFFYCLKLSVLVVLSVVFAAIAVKYIVTMEAADGDVLNHAHPPHYYRHGHHQHDRFYRDRDYRYYLMGAMACMFFFFWVMREFFLVCVQDLWSLKWALAPSRHATHL